MTTAAGADAVRSFRRALQRRRLANFHWVDALYRVYMTALVGGVLVLLISDRIGDEAVRGAALDTVRERGPAVAGLFVAAAVAIGLRSGSRGGPLALERADIRHILLAPVDRAAALRAPAIHQVRFALFVGAVVGGIAGDLVSSRFPESELAWIGSGALFGLTTVALAMGVAMAASGVRLPAWAASGLAVILLAWAVADAVGLAEETGVALLGASPTRFVGEIFLWPIGFDPWEILALPLAAAMLVFGFLRLNRVSLESAEQRSTLVGQLRFAATLQDVRTVIVLRRQLALELPRVRPWIRIRARGHDRFPVWTRGWRGVLRWPLTRVARLLLAAAVAGLAMRGVYDGSTPLIALAGVALYIAGLEAVEPLAQEVDHPTRRDGLPEANGTLHLKHVPTVVGVLIPVAAVAAAVGVLVDPSVEAVAVAAVCVVPAALGAAMAGLVSTIKGAPDPFENQMLMPPEAAGPRLAFRTALPPALAVLGVLPVLLGRIAAERGRSPAAGASDVVIFVVITFALVCGWVRSRDDFRQRMHEQMGQQLGGSGGG